MVIPRIAIVALTTFFATIGPVDLGPMLAALTPDATPRQRRRIALKSVLIATTVLLAFALVGQALLDHMGISLVALRIAGGILLLILGVDLVFGRGTETTRPPTIGDAEASDPEPVLERDVSVFPLAIPLTAGPGTMGAVLLLMAEAQGDIRQQAYVIGALLANLTLVLLMMLFTQRMDKLVGTTGLHVISRVVGVLLSALAVQFILDGLLESGLV